MGFGTHLCGLVVMCIRSDVHRRERLLSSFFFALSILLLMVFVFENFKELVPAELRLVFCSFVTLFLSVQLVLLGCFDLETEDGAFEVLQVRQISTAAWFCAKVLHGFLQVVAIFAPTMAIATVAVGAVGWDSAAVYFAVALVSALGMIVMGVLLSAITLAASGKELLFPTLFYPLATPVMLGAIEAATAFVIRSQPEVGWRWIGVVCGFIIIYTTLGVLLFQELVSCRRLAQPSSGGTPVQNVE